MDQPEPLTAELVTPSGESSRDLLLRAATGDPMAARALIDETGPIVYGFVYARVGGVQGVAEDLVQATFLEAMRSAKGYRGEAALSTWLCTIARRQVARHFRSERRRSVVESRLRVVGAEPDDDLTEELIADSDSIIDALGRIPPLHRQVLVLKYLDDLSVEKIADELGRSRVQVQSLLQRARASLRRAFEESSDE
ncbi:MAG TPA: RNA polymerase sigma factor [Actinomycetota bacterium]|nr:RNA polymerase sigma factor [Actinomycetota bacterium]